MGEGGRPCVLESEKAVLNGDEKPEHRRECKSNTEDCGPYSTNGDEEHSQQKTANGLQKEEWPDRRDVAVTERLPQMEVDVTRPDDQQASGHERSGRCPFGQPVVARRSQLQCLLERIDRHTYLFDADSESDVTKVDFS